MFSNGVGLVIVDKCDGKDPVCGEAAAKIQVVPGRSEQIEFGGRRPVLHEDDQEARTFGIFEAQSQVHGLSRARLAP